LGLNTVIVDDEARRLIGVWSEPVPACDPVEQGAVRRFAQAIMDDSRELNTSPAPAQNAMAT